MQKKIEIYSFIIYNIKVKGNFIFKGELLKGIYYETRYDSYFRFR